MTFKGVLGFPSATAFHLDPMFSMFSVVVAESLEVVLRSWSNHVLCSVGFLCAVGWVFDLSKEAGLQQKLYVMFQPDRRHMECCRQLPEFLWARTL